MFEYTQFFEEYNAALRFQTQFVFPNLARWEGGAAFTPYAGEVRQLDGVVH